MLWYGSFFGKHEQVNAFFGIPAHHAEAADSHADDATHGDTAAAETETQHAAEETQGEDHAVTVQEDPAHAPVMASDHGAAPEGAIFMAADNHVMDDAHHAPKWVKVSPFIAMLIGFVTAYWFYIVNPDMPRRLAENQRPLYNFLLNKWYFDEIYDVIFVKPAQGHWPVLLETRRWQRDRRGAERRGDGRGAVLHAPRRAGPVGIHLHLRLRHGDRDRCPDHLDGSLRGSTLMDNLLSIVTFIPALAALILLVFLRGEDEAAQRNAKWVALMATALTFLVSLFILAQFDPSDTGFQMVEEHDWLLGLQYKMGVDGISVLFVMLTTFIMPLTIWASWDVKVRVKEYMIAFLVLETLMLGVFMALDLVLFYLFFEGGLIPMFLIIGIWGGKERIYASFKFFLYTFLGSVLMLVAMVGMFADAGTTDMVQLLKHQFGSETFSLMGFQIIGGMQTLLWLAFFASFAVKMPMWPVHTWLPDAHVQAPTAGSVVLAAILLKMGGYGFLRFSLPMFPVASDLLAPLVFWMSAIAIVYTSLVALVQEDMKKLIAYSARSRIWALSPWASLPPTSRVSTARSSRC